MQDDETHIGRPSKLTPEIRKECIRAFALGLSLTQVSGHFRVHPETMRLWVNNNTDGLTDDLQHALSENLVGALETIRAGGHGSMGLRWWLERVDPQNWSVNEPHKYEALAGRTKASLTNG